MLDCNRIIVVVLGLLLLEIRQSCYGQTHIALKAKQTLSDARVFPPKKAYVSALHSELTKADEHDVVVGNFRVVYNFPSVVNPLDSDQEEAAMYQSLYYLRDYLPALLGVESIGQDVFYNWTYNGDELAADWFNYRIKYESDAELTPDFIFQQIDKSMSFNDNYTVYMQELDTFKDLHHAEVTDYVAGTPYPTTAPFPSYSPSPIPNPAPSPVTNPTIEAYVGNFTLEYTSDVIVEPTSDEYIAVIDANGAYFYEVVALSYPEYSVYSFVSQFNAGFAGAGESPTIYVTAVDYTFYFDVAGRRKKQGVPTVEIIQQLLLDSVNLTYVELIQNLDNAPFGTISKVRAFFPDAVDVPTVSPTNLDLTDAPVPKSKRKPHSK